MSKTMVAINYAASGLYTPKAIARQIRYKFGGSCTAGQALGLLKRSPLVNQIRIVGSFVEIEY